MTESPRPAHPQPGHPRHRLDPLIHSPVRFSIIAALSGGDQVQFGYLRDLIEVTDATLSKQLTQLEDAGYVTIKKGYVGKRPRTWVRLSCKGRERFEDHVSALREIETAVIETGAGRSTPASPVSGK